MSGLDWPGLMRAGMGRAGPGCVGLGLRPAQFWVLTPAELALMLGVDEGAGGRGAMTRARLDELAAQFPDAGAAGGLSAPRRAGATPPEDI